MVRTGGYGWWSGQVVTVGGQDRWLWLVVKTGGCGWWSGQVVAVGGQDRWLRLVVNIHNRDKFLYEKSV